jgi:hypothetical protein
VLNNPLNYTDPSGYAWIDNKQNQQIFRTVVSIAVVAFAPQILGVANHAAMTAGQKIFIGAVSGAIQTGTLRGALISAFSAGVSHGIGGHFDKAEALNGGTLSIPDTVKKIMAHAVAGGVAETLRGGKFGHGFASAGFVELAGPHVSTALGGSAAGQIVTSAILGGTASHLVGGKFANGAATAAMQWAFNELGDENLIFEGLSDNEQDLAIILMSEAGIYSVEELQAVGSTVLNRMSRNGLANVSEVRGYVRNQHPDQRSMRMAVALLDGSVADNTGGATHYYSPKSMARAGDELAAKGTKGYRRYHGQDIGGGLEQVSGLGYQTYRPAYTLSSEFTYVPIHGVQEKNFKFFVKAGAGKVR